KAVYAHHSTKKARLAKKYRARYGPDSPASLADDLGDLGIYFNEHRHHKGHVVAGICSAMRRLMAVEIQRPTERLEIQGLTDVRVSRANGSEARHFAVGQFPRFYHYAGFLRTVLVAGYESGIVLSPMIGKWR